MKAILVLIDFSESSLSTASYAASLTHQLNVSTLIIYHSNTIPHRATEISLLHEHTIELLESLKQQVRPFINERTQIRLLTDERPLLAAVNFISDEYKVELIVMGTTGKGNVQRMMVGSNTINVARECIPNLLLVPPKAKFENIKKLLFATDLKKVYDSTPVEDLKKLVYLFKAQLLVVNVITPDSDLDTSLERSALERLFEKEQPEFLSIKAQHITGGIMECAISRQVQIIIVVRKKQGLLGGLLHHSITGDLANHTYLPLLLLK